MPNRRIKALIRHAAGPCRGFTLLEMGIALGVLLTALIAASVLIHAAGRHQRLVWQDAIAAELATSTLEKALADPDLQPTPVAGKAITIQPPGRANSSEVLPGVRAVLHVTALAGRTDLLHIRAVVSWTCADSGESTDRSVERISLRRAKP
ncbi:MAG TPA: hypothetical protein VEK08_20930 [Planctomycetota bacterium]|nr:hypothetical protein [Planctomycetota bacterium]